MAGGTVRRWNGTMFIPDPSAFEAVGGNATYTVSGYKVHVFTDGGNFTVSTGTKDVQAFLVAGGGAGSGGTAGGGGGGGVIFQTFTNLSTGVYPINVGLGGASSGAATSAGLSGENSTGLGFTAHGGGYGSHTDPSANYNAADGGNGGGACNYAGNIGTPGIGTDNFTAVQGGLVGQGGGWGGAGAGGPNPTITRDGGPGISNDWLGTTLYYAGGGGGAGNGDSGAGGTGGGGAGSTSAATSGLVNTGGGGGGGWLYAGGIGGSGGSGIIIVRYLI